MIRIGTANEQESVCIFKNDEISMWCKNVNVCLYLKNVGISHAAYKDATFND